MKTSIVLGVSFVAALAVHAAPATAPSSAKPFDPSTFKPSSWSLYYGNWRPDMVDRLAADLVVVVGANIAGFVKVADAMVAQGVV